MKKEKLILYFLIAGSLTICSFTSKPSADYVTDPPLFIPNTNSGWNTLSIYLNQATPDSVTFELILTQPTSVSWIAEQFIGTINNQNFRPKKTQIVGSTLFMNNNWSMRIEKTGEC